MDIIRAIPKSMLIHDVTHAKTNADRWGIEELIDEQELKSVRIEPSSKVVRDKNGAEIQLAALMFYDCKNSRPKDISFTADDIIIFNGQKFQVKIAEPLYDEKKLHHWELGMISHA